MVNHGVARSRLPHGAVGAGSAQVQGAHARLLCGILGRQLHALPAA